MTDMRGTWYVVPTPFTETGDVDLESQARLVSAAVDWGVDGLTVLGVMSEVSSLADDEREQILTVILKAVDGRVPVAVGCSGAAASLVRRRVESAAGAGAAAVMVSAPQLLRNSDALPRFYEQAVGGTGVQAVVQDEPAATGVLVPVSVLLRCLQAASTDVIKLEDPPTPPKITSLLSADSALKVFGGLGGVSALSELTRGACGTMTGFAFPEVLRVVREAVERGDHTSAGRIFDAYLPLIQFEAQPVVGVAIRKEVLRLRGVIASSTTRGIAPRLDPVTSRELVAVLDRVGVLPTSDRLEVRL